MESDVHELEMLWYYPGALSDSFSVIRGDSWDVKGVGLKESQMEEKKKILEESPIKWREDGDIT